MMMEYEEFRKKVMEELPHYLGVTVDVGPVDLTRNNGRVDSGISVRRIGSNIGPAIYLDGYYHEYVLGRDFHGVMEKIARLCSENLIEAQINTAGLTRYDQVKGQLCCTLVNGVGNEAFLKDKPWTPMEGLAVIYRISSGHLTDQIESITITNEMLDHYGVSKETLHRDAMKNTRELYEPRFTHLAGLMDELKTDVPDAGFISLPPKDLLEEVPMYVLTNDAKWNGAVNILYPDVMDQVAAVVGKDFYVLPSSIHEVLIVPKSMEEDYRGLEEMVETVNATMLDPEEILSDHVYGVDMKEHRLYRCDLEEQRIMARKFKERVQEKTDAGKRALKKSTPRKYAPKGPKL